MPAVLGNSQRSACSGSGKASTGHEKPERNAIGKAVNNSTCKARSRSRNQQPSSRPSVQMAGT
ncbi:Uncharacterised protein [Mycobacterium tuberculosis]|nr:Uncharacterised protein [Mycobacterium tuberculosis]